MIEKSRPPKQKLNFCIDGNQKNPRYLTTPYTKTKLPGTPSCARNKKSEDFLYGSPTLAPPEATPECQPPQKAGTLALL